MFAQELIIRGNFCIRTSCSNQGSSRQQIVQIRAIYPNNDKNDNQGERYNESFTMAFCFDNNDNYNDNDNDDHNDDDDIQLGMCPL